MFKDDKCRKSLHKTLLGALRRREENNIKVYTRRYLGHCDVERRIILKLTLHN